jgi:hypothetical protein
MSSIRVVLRWEGGFVLDRGSEEERERGRQATRTLVWEKWKADPGITCICYYHRPQTYHCAVFEVDDFAKIDEMNEDLNAARNGGWLVTARSMEIVLGDSRWDEWWAS